MNETSPQDKNLEELLKSKPANPTTQTSDTAYVTAQPIDKAHIEQAMHKEKRLKTIKTAIFIISATVFLIALLEFMAGINEKCGSSCGAVSVGFVRVIFSTPTMAYAVSLFIAGIINKKENHQILWILLWSIMLFIPICFIAVQIVRAMLGI